MVLKSGTLGKFLPGWTVNEKDAISQIFSEGIDAIATGVQKKYRDMLLSILRVTFSPQIEKNNAATISQIGKEIENTLEYAKNGILNSRSRWKHKKPVMKNILEVKYKIFLFWILEKFKRKGFNLDINNLQDVPDENGESIYNILRDRWLTTFFMLAKSFGLLDYSENIINKFPKENEIKVLDTSYSDVQGALERWSKENKWVKYREDSEVEVIDTYYDDINLRLDRQNIEGTKRSFRIRKKIYSDGTVKSFYTIKRKEPEKKGKKEQGTIESLKTWEVEARDCFENEFEILHPKIFELLIIEDIWLRESRSKSKKRKSFSIEFEYKGKIVHAKLDIDDYQNGIPEFLEIECDDNLAISYIIEKLWIPEWTVVLTSGSRGLFEYYNKQWKLQEEYKKKYKVDEATWEITWENGEKGNTKIHPVIRKSKKKNKH